MRQLPRIVLMLLGALHGVDQPNAPVQRSPRPIAVAAKPAPKVVPAAVSERQSRRDVYAFIASRGGIRAADRYAGLIVAHARAESIPPLLVAAVVNRESSFSRDAENNGCYGLMQVAAFHFHPGEDPRDPETNLRTGCKLLSGFYRRFGSWPQALTAYNFGPGATVSRGLETSHYAKLVLSGK